VSKVCSTGCSARVAASPPIAEVASAPQLATSKAQPSSTTACGGLIAGDRDVGDAKGCEPTGSRRVEDGEVAARVAQHDKHCHPRSPPAIHFDR